MAERTRIEWAHATFNPWLGCEKVSPACDRCYAEGWAKRTGQAELWNGERRRTSENYWRQPAKWNREAATAGMRPRVFCASLADVFDKKVPQQWRSDLFALIEDTPNLDWLLLTKRIEDVAELIWPKWDRRLPPNIWLGTTVEDRDAECRIAHLAMIQARVRFLSCEPLIGPVRPSFSIMKTYIHWIISGDESGPGARATDPEWRVQLRRRCGEAGVAFFQKQITIRGRKVPFEDWPPDMQIREFPT